MKTILFQGDSITDAGRLSDCSAAKYGIGYARLVSSVLGFENLDEFDFINRGISGNRVVDV